MKPSYLWSGVARQLGDRNAWLKLLALIFIGVAAGPEIGLAIEMTTVLEILGAAIFFLSFRVGAQMLILDLAASARDFVRPPVVAGLNRPGAVVYVAARTLYLVVLVLIPARFCLELAWSRLA